MWLSKDSVKEYNSNVGFVGDGLKVHFLRGFVQLKLRLHLVGKKLF